MRPRLPENRQLLALAVLAVVAVWALAFLAMSCGVIEATR